MVVRGFRLLQPFSGLLLLTIFTDKINLKINPSFISSEEEVKKKSLVYLVRGIKKFSQYEWCLIFLNLNCNSFNPQLAEAVRLPKRN